jgi:hypothetical protein
MRRRPLQFRPGPMQVPRPGTTRGRWLARQRIDDAAGRFNERVFAFTFAPIDPGAFAMIEQSVTSLGGRFVRCTSCRANVDRHFAGTGMEMANMALRVQLNGQADLIGGNGNGFATLATLFSSFSSAGPPVTLTNSPWLQWLSPPVFRAGDLLRLTLVNTFLGEGSTAIGAQISFRLIDDELWQELWNRDARAPLYASPGGPR